jgi:preprotein translocase subunit SecB
MTEETQQPQQAIGIHGIYLKDVSFESPNAPSIFQEMKQAPSINVNFAINTEKLSDETYEIVLSITVTAKIEEKTAFLVELQQAGLFTIKGFGEQEMAPMLGIYCPTQLFPYAREAVANLVGKGGFPPVMLEPVNFEALYRQHQQQQQTNSTH